MKDTTEMKPFEKEMRTRHNETQAQERLNLATIFFLVSVDDSSHQN